MDKSRIALIVIFGGIAVFAIKFLAFIISNSMALFSDALESIINIVASIMMFISIRVASKPPDEYHQFGHKKAENISCLIEGLLILIAAFFIFEASFFRLLDPVDLLSINLALVISLAATSVNGTMAFFMMRESRKKTSIALEGDAKHLLSDVLSSVGVVVGLFVASLTGWFILDSLLAIFMALLITKIGIGLIRKSSGDLLDHSCPIAEEQIRTILDRREGFIEYHDLRTRKSGDTIFVVFHICVGGEVSVHQSHELTEKLEKELGEKIPGIDVTIHVESEDQACHSK